MIDTVNANAYVGELGTLVTTATNAVDAAEKDPAGDVAAPGTGTLVDAAQEAIDALPAEITEAEATAAGTVVTIKADLQEKLDKVKLLVPVIEAGNQIELLPALAGFERVNEDWIGDYYTSIDALPNVVGTKDFTVAAVQGAIDNDNNTRIGGLDTAANTAAKQAAVTALIEEFVIADDPATPLVTPKADAIEASQVKEAAFKVAEATTEAGLYDALVALADLDSTNLPATALNANLKAEYFTELDDAAKTAIVTTPSGTTVNNEVVTTADTAALTAALAEIDGLTSTNTAAEVKAALQELADVTAHKTGADKFDMSSVKDAQLLDYVTLETNGFEDASITTIALVNTAITGVNADVEEDARLAAVNAATTPAEMRTALTAVAIAETDGYVDLTSQEKLEVAELVLVARADETDEEFALTSDVTAAIGTATLARTTFLGSVAGATGVNGATTISGMVTALDDVVFPEFQDLGDLEQVDVAELVLNELNRLQNLDTPEEFETIAEVKAAAGL